MGKKKVEQNLYSHAFSQEELACLADAAAREDLHDEIVLLKVLIKREIERDADEIGTQSEDGTPGKKVDPVRIARFVAALCHALKVQHSLKGRAARVFEEARGLVLTEIGEEHGIVM
ncbi:MAG: hypothetical protein M1343_00600 [Chloroflexi bacterium]|nr:hypothetical protein [Chloroflexota bacterium]MDA8186750.1 hypothetical protein [Dehalococcoidales bacterium]